MSRGGPRGVDLIEIREVELCLRVGEAEVQLQQLVGLPPSEWLRLDDDPAAMDPNPFFQSRNPFFGTTFATAFALCVALAAQLLGLEWLPGPRPWPEPGRAALLLLIAPLSEEAFFRAYLMTALERAGAPANAALLASAAGFALYHVPLAEMLFVCLRIHLTLNAG